MNDSAGAAERTEGKDGTGRGDDWRSRRRRRIIRLVIGAAIGAAIGFGYNQLVGCSGGCPITGNPYIATVYGATLGALVGGG